MLNVRGELTAGDPDTLWTNWQTLKAACLSGTQNLYFGRDDRYVPAQLEQIADDYQEGLLYGLIINVSMGFRAACPYFLAASGAVTTSGLAAGGTVTNTGNVLTYPTWSITIGTAGTGSVTLVNSTSGESMTISGTFAAGDVIVISRPLYTVTLNGAANFGILTGRIPLLVAGNNTITIAAATVTVSAASCVYTPQYA